MRGFDCVAPDGAHAAPHHFEAESDEGILEQAREHVAEYHSALGLGEDQISGMIAQGAYDVGATSA